MKSNFEPLDPGRIEPTDPEEVRFWCTELHCSEAALAAAVAAVGTHVTAVRDHLAAGRGDEAVAPAR